MNILEKANEIVFNRKEEKERQYGPFEDGMLKASKIATELCNKDITVKDIYMCMVALKLSRESYNHKEDNLLDLVAYIASYNSTLEK
jgi:hypothetical protein